MTTNISTFTYKGQDIEILYYKNKISYVFEIDGRRFGNAVNVEGKKATDIINASFALILNFIETYDKASAE